LIEEKIIDEGYVIFLTNEQAYWSNSNRINSYEDFKMHEGHQSPLKDELKFDVRISDNAANNKFKGLHIKRSHKFAWQDYSSIETSNKSTVNFRYLLVKV